MRRTPILVMVVAVLVVMLAPAAIATPPMDVEIVADITIDDVAGPFVASGAAVDAGLMCDVGEAEGVLVTQPRAHKKSTTFKIDYTFTCDDGSGTFVVRLNVRLFETGDTTARWRITDGSNTYVDLKGNGRLVGIPNDPPDGMILDVYTGTVHIN